MRLNTKINSEEYKVYKPYIIAREDYNEYTL